MLKRKHPRLKDNAVYKDKNLIVHGIFCFKSSVNSDLVGEAVVRHIKQISHEFKITVYAYSVMPNHVHLLVSQNEDFGISDFIKYLKGRTTSELRKSEAVIIFQKSFYDHVVREDEELLTIVEYIVGNPVRKGITKLVGEHKFSGSLVYTL